MGPNRPLQLDHSRKLPRLGSKRATHSKSRLIAHLLQVDLDLSPHTTLAKAGRHYEVRALRRARSDSVTSSQS